MPDLTGRELSDLFRWMVETDRIGDRLASKLSSEEIEELCWLIEGTSRRWQSEWDEYQRSLPAVGIGMNPTFQG